MNFPERDLSNQFISRSYQDVVQQFLNTGSFLYLLDGYGNVIFQIPSSSYGGIILTQDQSASYALQALSASYAPGSPSISASYALSSSYAFSSSYAITATMADVATFAEQSLTASVADTASIAISASYAGTASVLLGSITSASYALSASKALSASYSTTASTALTSISASSAVTASYTVYSATVITATNNTTTSIISNPNTIYSSMFVNYVLTDTQNYRAGNIVVLYTTSSAVLSETCTTDIGNSNGLQFSASISASFVNLLVVNSTPNDYSIKYHYDVL